MHNPVPGAVAPCQPIRSVTGHGRALMISQLADLALSIAPAHPDVHEALERIQAHAQALEKLLLPPRPQPSPVYAAPAPILAV